MRPNRWSNEWSQLTFLREGGYLEPSTRYQALPSCDLPLMCCHECTHRGWELSGNLRSFQISNLNTSIPSIPCREGDSSTAEFLFERRYLSWVWTNEANTIETQNAISPSDVIGTRWRRMTTIPRGVQLVERVERLTFADAVQYGTSMLVVRTNSGSIDSNRFGLSFRTWNHYLKLLKVGEEARRCVGMSN